MLAGTRSRLPSGCTMVICAFEACAALDTGAPPPGDLLPVAEGVVPVAEVMTRQPHTIEASRLAVEAVQMMEAHKINQLLAVDAAGQLLGALNMHDLFRAKVV
jgi:arabinose-5-phosphate isomerase